MTRRSRLRKLLRIGLFVVIVAFTILALIASWISLCGRSRWAHVKASLLAHGEKLSLVELAPPPIPAKDNFFADPLWREMMDRLPDGKPRVPYKQRQIDSITREMLPPDLAARIKSATRAVGDPNMRMILSPLPDGVVAIHAAGALMTAARRDSDPDRRREFARLALEALEPVSGLLRYFTPLLESTRARAPIEYEKNISAPMDHISELLLLGRAYSARAQAELTLGSHDAALKDVLSSLRLANTLETEPITISQLVRISVIAQSDSAIDWGLTLHAWTDEELRAIDQALSGIHPIDRLPLALRGERGSINMVLEHLQTGGDRRQNLFDLVAAVSIQGVQPDTTAIPIPVRPLYLAIFKAGDQAALNASIQNLIDLTSGKTIDIEAFPSRGGALINKPLADIRFYFTLTVVDSLQTSITPFVRIEDRIRLTRIACALERYHLRHGQYPETLDALVPELLAEIPAEMIAGQSFRYRRDGADFRLWSNGWDRRDDGGTPNPDPRKERDWTWDSR